MFFTSYAYSFCLNINCTLAPRTGESLWNTPLAERLIVLFKLLLLSYIIIILQKKTISMISETHDVCNDGNNSMSITFPFKK